VSTLDRAAIRRDCEDRFAPGVITDRWEALLQERIRIVGGRISEGAAACA
jgi:hypothetical protein